jgi:hypothetical protein
VTNPWRERVDGDQSPTLYLRNPDVGRLADWADSVEERLKDLEKVVGHLDSRHSR